MGEAVEDQVLVDLVTQHDQVAFAREFGDRSKFVIGEYGAGGVVRTVDDQHLRLGGDRAAQCIEIDRKSVSRGYQRNCATYSACQRDGCSVGVVVRLDQHYFFAGFDQSENCSTDRLGGADGDQNFGVGITDESVADAPILRDGLAQDGHARTGRVLIDAFGDGSARYFEHGRRTVGIRKALTEVDRVVKCGQRCHLGEDRGCERLQTRDGAVAGRRRHLCSLVG